MFITSIVIKWILVNLTLDWLQPGPWPRYNYKNVVKTRFCCELLYFFDQKGGAWHNATPLKYAPTEEYRCDDTRQLSTYELQSEQFQKWAGPRNANNM